MALQAICGQQANPIFKFGRDERTESNDEIENEANLREFTKISLYPGRNIPGNQEILMDPTGKNIKMDFKKGTTTLAFKYQGGILVAVDSRATGGQYISSGTVQKFIPINKYLVGTMAGGAADCAYWHRVLTVRCRQYELRNRERMSTAAASKLLANILYNYKGMGLSLGVMIAGWDKKGPELYLVTDDGVRSKGDIFSVGSGSSYAYGILDSGYSYDLTDEQAQELGRRAIFHAGHRDAMSGNSVRVYVMKADGWRKLSHEDCTELYYKFQSEKEEQRMDV